MSSVPSALSLNFRQTMPISFRISSAHLACLHCRLVRMAWNDSSATMQISWSVQLRNSASQGVENAGSTSDRSPGWSIAIIISRRYGSEKGLSILPTPTTNEPLDELDVIFSETSSKGTRFYSGLGLRLLGHRPRLLISNAHLY